jgi:uncharacterized lipoprotein YajG
MKRQLLVLAILFVTGGCASTKALDVVYPPDGVNRALLASAKPKRVALGPVTDRRRDVRVGVQPESKKDIVTRRPVSEIVRDALALELGANGHTVTADRADVVVAVDVEDFRLDVTPGYSSAQWVGKVVIALAVSDGHSGLRLLDRRYVGIHRRQADLESETAAREVMTLALTRAMRDVATDPDLVRSFARAATALAR